MTAGDFSQREQAILEEIIRYYMEHQEAISARTLSKISRLSLSPTTIRNLMEDLATAGLLTSEGGPRGRIPTQKAFTIYVTRLGQEAPDSTGKTPEESGIPALPEGPQSRLRQVMDQYGDHLARQSGCAVVAALPPRDQYPLQWVRFSSLPAHQVLVTVQTKYGELWTKILQADDPFPEDLLGEVGRFINENFAGKTLESIRADIMAGEPKELLEKMPSLGAAFRMLRKAFEWEESPVRQTWGIEYLYGVRECNSPQCLRNIHDAMTDPDFLANALPGGRALGGGRVSIGTELRYMGLEHCALVAHPFGRGTWLGWLAVLGPIHLDYQAVYHLTRQTCAALGEYLEVAARPGKVI